MTAAPAEVMRYGSTPCGTPRLACGLTGDLRLSRHLLEHRRHPRCVVLVEGQNHQVKRMLGACGAHVCALHRERIGGLSLADCEPPLAEGAVRALTEKERAILAADLAIGRQALHARDRPPVASQVTCH